jgi:hypothetical protein
MNLNSSSHATGGQILTGKFRLILILVYKQVFVPFKIFLLKYSGKKYLKENSLPKSSGIKNFTCYFKSTYNTVNMILQLVNDQCLKLQGRSFIALLGFI